MTSKPFYKYHEPVNYRDTWRIFKIMSEFVEGYQFMAPLHNEITVFGSARTKPNNKFYQMARKTAHLLGKNGYTIITGGGPGIMEAANRGATEAKAESVGLNIQLPMEQVLNKYVKKSLGFHYFFTRKTLLTAPSHGFLYYPGGFGTMDEFFEVMDTMELGKMAQAPVGIAGKEFWQPVVDFLEKSSIKEAGALREEHLQLFKILNTPQDALAMIGKPAKRPHVGELEPEKFAGGEEANWRIFRIMSELVEGFEFLTKLKNDVTILGTNSIRQGSPFYEAAYDLAKKLGRQKYSIITGGGSGIMEAANKGAYDAGAESAGLNIRFDHQIRVNPYVKSAIGFFFPFVRKLIITAPSLAFVIFPGGFGTMHQLFELLTLVQTGKMGRMPLILFGKKFWQPLDNFIKNELLRKFKTIEAKDTKLYRIVDKVDEAVKIIRTVPRDLKNSKFT